MAIQNKNYMNTFKPPIILLECMYSKGICVIINATINEQIQIFCDKNKKSRCQISQKLLVCNNP